MLVAVGIWVFCLSGYKAKHFGDRTILVGFVVLLSPILRIGGDTLWYGWDHVIDNAAIRVLSWALLSFCVVSCYCVGYWLGRKRRNRFPKIIPLD